MNARRSRTVRKLAKLGASDFSPAVQQYARLPGRQEEIPLTFRYPENHFRRFLRKLKKHAKRFA